VSSDLDDAFDAFHASIGGAADFLRGHRFYDDAENRAPAYAFLSSLLIARIEESVISDADFPFFRVIDRRSREGSDNPDQRYLVARLRGGAMYRVWGTVGSATRVELQVYAGNPYLPGSVGRSASNLAFEDLAVDGDGRFEVLLAPERVPGNWLENPIDGTKLFVRQIYSSWETDSPAGDIHIDRVDAPGELPPPLTEAVMAARLQEAARELDSHVRIWPTIVERFAHALAPNELSMPADSSHAGGVPGRYMSHGTFELDPGEALIVSVWPGTGNYQGIQLLDLYQSSLEYADRQTSLTGEQAHCTADGRYHLVLAAEDPGVVNWLDTMGRHRGMVLARYDGMAGQPFDAAHRPVTNRVPVASLAEHLPDDMARVTAEERAQALAARRRHLQLRFGV